MFHYIIKRNSIKAFVYIEIHFLCFMMTFMTCSHNIYIHVPFCMSKCNYCAFYSFACNTPDWQKYANDITTELQFWANKLGRVHVPTVFFGGGTPSLMPVTIFEKIVNCINTNFNINTDCEITLESNPGTLDTSKLADFKSLGMNRLSVGVQSLTDSELQFLGRRHNVADAVMLLEKAQNMGLRVSADFIYGLPNQDVKSVIKLCENINRLGLSHVSLYELTIEKNTPFGKMNLQMPDNDTMAQMYTAISENLSLPKYEVSNYALPDEHCRHNENIWAGDAYIGVGRAAAGRIFIDETWYDEMGNYERFEKINDETRNTEKIITGMRTTKGVLLSDGVKKQIDFDWVKNHSDLVIQSDNYLRTTPNGMLMLDNIMLDLIK